MVNGEVVGVVEGTHAVGDVVHSNTVVLKVDNHTNGLGEGILF